MKGGLGEVSFTVPSAFKDHSERVGVFTLEPFGSMSAKDPAWKDTGLDLKLTDFPTPAMEAWLSHQMPQTRYATAASLMPKQSFRLMQKIEPQNGMTRWAIANDTYFKPYSTLYPENAKAYADIRDLGGSKTIAMFNRAARAFMPYLSGKKALPEGARLDLPPGGMDFVWANDAHVAPILSAVKADQPQMERLMMLHNVGYDVTLPTDAAEAVGMDVSHNASADPGHFSQLAQGIEDAHKVILDGNYKNTLLNTKLMDEAHFIPALRKSNADGRAFAIHHFLDPKFDPALHPALTTDGFTQLKNGLAGLGDFKRQNKAALQQWAGLKQDPDAIIFGYAARFDPYQKGFTMLMDSMKELLDKYPKAQLAIAGKADEDIPGLKPLIEELTRPGSPYEGRVFLPNKFMDRPSTVKIFAGSDFTILPSLYEPYGLTQLEALKMGSVPLVQSVDGLRSTLSDPAVNNAADGPPSKAWDYGQTAVMFKLPDVVAYRRTMAPLMHGEKLTEAQEATIKDGARIFQQAFDRAVTLASKPDEMRQVRENGVRYVNTEHASDAIIKRYEDIFAAVPAPERSKTPA